MKKKGFTLIELLIVIAIIGIISSLLMANFVGIRQRARDTQRKTDLRSIQAALELHRSDASAYPATIPNCGGTSIKNESDCSLNTVYMQKVPTDPSESSWYNSGNYAYSTDTVTYTLGACLENASDKDPQIQPTPPPGCNSNKFFVVSNP